VAIAANSAGQPSVLASIEALGSTLETAGEIVVAAFGKWVSVADADAELSLGAINFGHFGAEM
jgi:hypothetical protein